MAGQVSGTKRLSSKLIRILLRHKLLMLLLLLIWTAAVPGAEFLASAVTAHSPSSDIALTETDMATNSHRMLKSAIDERCAKSGRTTFQTAALNTSEAIRDQRIQLSHAIENESSYHQQFGIWAVLLGALASMAVGLKPLFENVRFLNFTLAALAIICSSSVAAVSSLNNSGFHPKTSFVTSVR